IGERSFTHYKGVLASLAAMFFLGITFYIGAPTLGTNAGGAISAVVAFGLAWSKWFTDWWSKAVSWSRLIFTVTGAIVLSLGLLWLLHTAWPNALEQETHIGRAMRLVMSGDLQAIMNMIVRKLSMNWHLIGVSSWSKVLLT